MKKLIAAASCIMMLVVSAQAQAQDQIVPYAAPQQAGLVFQGVPQAPVAFVPSNPIPGFQPGFPQPGYPQQGIPGFQPLPYPPVYNPAVIQTPTQVQSVQYDQFGRAIVNTGSQTVFNSALNAGRNQVVQGTLQNVNRYEMDAAGNRVHVTGQQWIGLDGQPHANLNRQTVTSNSNGTVINNNNQIQSYSTSGK